MIKIYPYKQGSRSAKILADTTGGRVLRTSNSKYRPRAGDIVINWGSSACPQLAPATTLNADVRAAQNKLLTFEKLRENNVSIPDFWTDPAEIAEDSFPVVCRTTLTGHSGQGIVIAERASELVRAPLYTRYVKKQDEYRVHCFRDRAFFIQRKARKLDVEMPDWRVRNLSGGFVFAAVGVEDVPPQVVTEALASIVALGLDFGGVDVIYNNRQDRAYVLEVNTACGLEERTAQLYAEQINGRF